MCIACTSQRLKRVYPYIHVPTMVSATIDIPTSSTVVHRIYYKHSICSVDGIHSN